MIAATAVARARSNPWLTLGILAAAGFAAWWAWRKFTSSGGASGSGGLLGIAEDLLEGDAPPAVESETTTTAHDEISGPDAQGTLFGKFLSPVNMGSIDQPGVFSSYYPVTVRLRWTGAKPITVPVQIRAQEDSILSGGEVVTVVEVVTIPGGDQPHLVEFNVPFAQGYYLGGVGVALFLEAGGKGLDAVAAYVDT